MFDFSLLAQINHKVYTTESQEQQAVSCNDAVDYNSPFISFICDVWNYDKNQFQNKRILSTLQRPYLELVASRDIGNKIFEQFQKDLDEAVRFGGDGEPPQTRVAARADQYTRPGTFDNPVTDQSTEPHAKTVISDKEPWEYTGDLGSSLGLKQKIDPENYESVLSRDFSTLRGY